MIRLYAMVSVVVIVAAIHVVMFKDGQLTTMQFELQPMNA